MRLALWFAVLPIVSCSALASAETVMLSPSLDGTLFEDANGDTASGAGPALFTGRNNQGRSRRALLAFDVASHISNRATIDSVSLVLHVSNVSDVLSRRFDLHRVLSNWGEGSSISMGGTGAEAASDDATWLHASYPTTFWRKAGGDFDPAVSASAILSDVGAYIWTSTAMAADVRSWLAEPSSDHGWILIGEEDEPGTARRLDSREGAIASDRPVLIVHYSTLVPLRGLTWGGIKAGYR